MTKDPFKYFRVEARELVEGLNHGVMEIEKGSIDKDVFARLLRLAHTLKGAARVVKQPAIAELAHKVEDALAPYREGNLPVPRNESSNILKLLDAIAANVSALDRPILSVSASPNPTVVEEPFTTVRVEVKQMDSLLEGISRLGTQLTLLQRQIDDVDQARRMADVVFEEHMFHRVSNTMRANSGKVTTSGDSAVELRNLLGRSSQSLVSHVEVAITELAQIRDLSHELRLIPASSIFGLLERSIRDAAQTTQKKVNLVTSGGEIRMDAHVIAAVRDALLHVVRNSVAHGIEPEQQRVSSGKPAAGCISLDIKRRGNRVALICHDDGRGIDVEEIRRVAIRRGLLSSAAGEALNLEQVIQLILRGGVTTTSAVTELSGRGIGLDVVRDTVASLKGELRLSSEPGRGTSVEICVPVSLSSLAVLVIDTGGTAASIPLDAVRQTMRVKTSEIIRAADGYSISYGGTVIPFQPLATILRRPSVSAKQKNSATIVVVQADSSLAAIGVDGLRGSSNVVVRSLPAPVVADPTVAGVSLDSAGNPQLLLDPKGVVDAVRAKCELAPHRQTVRPRPVLVIDDSLTTRMLEQSILTSAGFDVELASSAEEGIQMAREQKFSVFIVDVEMPGMDGFEFVERTRADPDLREIPAILVTSRNSAEDRLRGKQAGAHAYIVKGEFDQGFLLQTIHSLIG